MRKFLLFLLTRLSTPFWGRGIVAKVPIINRLYYSIFLSLNNTQTVLFEVGGVKMFGQSRSTLSQRLVSIGKYEEETTKLFNEILRDGMVVLDIGANIGYFSLIAAARVGESGKVFSFEPSKESFLLLSKNIKLNGYANVVPVEKAISKNVSKQQFFLVNDPASNSLFRDASGELSQATVEVETTTIDIFMRQYEINVDLVKMDVEGAETDVLDGMENTIRNNPNLKIITEFSPRVLERCNHEPSAFLKKLAGYGFGLQVIDDEKKTRYAITPANIDNVIRTTYARYPVPINIFCDRNSKQNIDV